MHCLWSKWAPPSERSRLSTFGLSGSYIGSVISMALGGIIGKYINWQAIFYFFGAASLVWTLLWFRYTAETPGQHSSISSQEKNFIESSLFSAASDDQHTIYIPWTRILRSPPFWAIVSAHFGTYIGFFCCIIV